MTRLAWGNPEQRFFESGVDRGVLYTNNLGVAWNGLISVSESLSGGEPRPAYIDGVKFRNIASSEEFGASLEAFSAPEEFGPCDGSVAIHNGLFATQQPRRAFGLSYRSRIGNAAEGVEHGYKIHLVYNALASPAARTHSTQSDSTEAGSLTWELTTLPPSLTGHKPTAHFVIDSRYTPKGLLKAIEDILYGSEVAAARLPLPSELVTLFQSDGPAVARNLFINPALVTGDGTSPEIRRNLTVAATYAAASGTLEVRRNHLLNPSFEVDAAGWSAARGTITSVTDAGAVSGTKIGRYVSTDGTVAGGNYLVSVSATAAPNERWSASISVKAQVTASKYHIRLQWFNAGTFISHDEFQSSADLSGTAFTRLGVSGIAPANTTLVRFQVTAVSALPVNSGFVVDAGLLEKCDGVLPYFDGSVSDASLGLTAAWTGTAHASVSILNGVGFTGAGLKGYSRPSWRPAPGRATDGTDTIMTPLASYNGITLAFFSTDTPAIAPGDVVSGRLRVRAVGVTEDVTLLPTIRAYSGSSIAIIAQSSPASVVIPKTGEWVEIALNSTVVAPAASVSGRHYHQITSSSRVGYLEISNVMVEKYIVARPWFHGATGMTDGLVHTWEGTAHQSVSLQYGSRPSPAISGYAGLLSWIVPYASPSGRSAVSVWPEGSPSTILLHGSFISAAIESDRYYSARVKIRAVGPLVGGEKIRIGLAAYTAAGANLGTLAPDQTITLTNDWVEYVFPAAVPAGAGATNARIYVIKSTGWGASPARVSISEPIIAPVSAAGDVAPEFFDGSTPDADGHFYNWSGAENASASSHNTWHLS